FFLVFLFVQILRNDIEVDGMGLRNFELRLALGTAQNLALFHFVFVHVDFGGTFGTADHVCIPPYSLSPGWALEGQRAPPSSVIYTAGRKSTPIGGFAARWATE